MLQLSGPQATAVPGLLARAKDANAPLSMLRDAHAARLAAGLGFATRASAPQGADVPVLRSLAIDGWVRAFLDRAPGGTVVELGVGLNTRFERVDRGQHHAVEIDLPDIVALRRSRLPQRARRVHLDAVAHQSHWHGAVAGFPAPYCFVLEAVVAYVPPEGVAALLTAIVAKFPRAQVLVDVPRAWPDVFASWTQFGMRLVEVTRFLDRSTCGTCPFSSAAFRVACFETLLSR